MTMERIRPEGAAPDFTPGYPSGGTMIGPGWQAVWDGMTPGRWYHPDALAEIAGTAANLQPSTTLNLLQSARRAGILEVDYRMSAPIGGKVRKRAFYRKPVSS